MTLFGIEAAICVAVLIIVTLYNWEDKRHIPRSEKVFVLLVSLVGVAASLHMLWSIV